MTFSRIPLIKTDLPPLEAVEAQFREILANGRVRRQQMSEAISDAKSRS